MIYTHATYWNHEGSTWHALHTNGRTRDLSMGTMRDIDVEKSIAWARSHGMIIEDKRAHGEER